MLKSQRECPSPTASVTIVLPTFLFLQSRFYVKVPERVSKSQSECNATVRTKKLVKIELHSLCIHSRLIKKNATVRTKKLVKIELHSLCIHTKIFFKTLGSSTGLEPKTLGVVGEYYNHPSMNTTLNNLLIFIHL